MISGNQLVCMRRQGRRELLPFDPKPERILHRLRREAHVTLSHPDFLSDPNGGSEPGSGRETIYWDSLPALSDIGMSKSYNYINILYTKIQNETTTVVVFTVSYTYSSESHLHIQNYTLHLHDQSVEPTVMNPNSCAGPAECGRSLSPSSVPTRIEKPVLSFTLSGKHT